MPIGQPFIPNQCAFMLPMALNANQFDSNVPFANNGVPCNLLWNFVENKLQWVRTSDNIILAEIGGGGNAFYLRAQLTSNLENPNSVDMVVLENTISDTLTFSKNDPGKYNIQFGTEKFAQPLKVDKTQFPQSGTFGGIFIQTLGGDILGASTVRYQRIDDFNVAISTFFIGSPYADELLDNHSLIIVRIAD